MKDHYTAVLKNKGDWWIGWIEEVPGVNCQERSKEELITLDSAGERGRYCDTRSRVALLNMIGGDDSARVSCHLFPHGGGVTGNGEVSSTS